MWRAAIRRLLGREEGFALLLALGMSVVLAILVISVVSYTTANSSSSELSHDRATAQALAEAGLVAAASIVNHAANASSPTLLGCAVSAQNVNNSAAPCSELAIPGAGGTSYVHGLYTQGNVNSGTWAISAYGAVPGAPGTADVSRTMTATITITGGGQSNNISVWNYVYSTAPQGSGCEVNLDGDHTTVDVPIYVTGDLCLSGDHATITENRASGGQAVDLRVGGTLTIGGDHASVGQDVAHPITSGYVALGCTGGYPNPHPCKSSDRYWVGNPDQPLAASPPATDFPGWYASSSPGPRHLCDPALTAGAFPGKPVLTAAGVQPRAFDNDTTMNGTNGTFVLTSTTSDWACVTSSGTLAWNHSTHLLTISGTIYFDGNVELDDGRALYHGKATIYVNGALSFNNGHGSAAGLRAGCPASPATPTSQCGMNTPHGWDPNQDMVIFAVNKASGVAVDLSVDHSEFQGDLLCTPGSTASLAGDHTAVEGGIICGRFLWGDHTTVYPLPTITNLPPGAPVPPNAPATISPPVLTG